MLTSPCQVLESKMENATESDDFVSSETLPESEKMSPSKSEDCGDVSLMEGTP